MGQYLLLSATFRDRDCKRNLYQSVAQRSYAILGYTVSVNVRKLEKIPADAFVVSHDSRVLSPYYIVENLLRDCLRF